MSEIVHHANSHVSTMQSRLEEVERRHGALEAEHVERDLHLLELRVRVEARAQQAVGLDLRVEARVDEPDGAQRPRRHRGLVLEDDGLLVALELEVDAAPAARRLGLEPLHARADHLDERGH